MVYHWQATLCLLAAVIGLSIIGTYVVGRIHALDEMRRINHREDAAKLAKEKYPPAVKLSKRVGLITNLVFFVAILPFFVTLQSQPLWQMVATFVAIIMVFDFLYYVTHRFLFHGRGYLRRAHALHHQARSPTSIDALYVHPVETFIGIVLFQASVVGLGLWIGPFNIVALAAAMLMFQYVNTINHIYIDVPKFPFRTLSWISAKHAAHHKNMQSGNYASITLFYDKLFGTFETGERTPLR